LSDDIEELVLKREDAEALAKPYLPGQNTKDPPQQIKDIPHSLLSAEHIRLVVEETGLISPFYIKGGRKSRLKKAAYEGRIGDKAYIYNKDGALELIFERDSHDCLTVPKNQIVFVECDLDFRLPEFIALRFNLQIQHVHRGLLLGTGPLIDPGYWGKLCIPLHNLTDHDYHIPKDEGLIWLEFTKTTSTPDNAKDPLGRPPLGGEFFGDIKKFLDKASKQYGPKGVPIRSALPSMFNESKDAAESAKKAAETTRNIGFVAGIAAIIGIVSLAVQYYSDMNTQFEMVRPRIEKLEAGLNADKLRQAAPETSTVIPDMKDQLRELEDRNKKLEQSIIRLEGEIERLQPRMKAPINQ